MALLSNSLWQGYRHSTNARLLVWLGVMLSIFLLAQFPVCSDWLLWQRQAIEQGQGWRLITGNLTHTNYSHLWLNWLALVGIGYFYRSYWRWRWLVWQMLSVMLMIGVVMLATRFTSYAGFSGVLYALLCYGAVRDCRQQATRRYGVIVLLATGIKITVDTLHPDPMMAAIIAATVANAAHWAGALMGIMLGVFSANAKQV